MKVCLTLICLLFFLTLQDGETVGTYRGKEGGSITVKCEFSYTGTRRFVCKETCEGENILIQTTKDRDQRGRFSIRYEERSAIKSDFLHVSITDLKTTDSGRYRCRSDETFHGTLYDHFNLFVTEALKDGETVGAYRGNEGGSIEVKCEFGYTGTKRFICKETCEGQNILIQTTEDRDQRGRFSIRYENRSAIKSDFLHVSIIDLKPSDSGRYRCRSDTWKGILYDHFDLIVIEDSSEPKWTPRPFIGSTFLPAASSTQSFSPSPSETIKFSDKPAAASGQQLYVILSLVIKILLLSTPLVIFWWKRRAIKSKDSAVETENADEIFTVYS